MSSNIEITVTGRTGAGKSSVVTLIAQALTDCGFAVNVKIPDVDQLPVNGAFLRQLAARLSRDGDSVVIHEVTAATYSVDNTLARQ